MDEASQSTNADESEEVGRGFTVGCPIVGTFLSSCAGYVMVSMIVHNVAMRKRNNLLKRKERGDSRSLRSRSRGKTSKRLSNWLGYLCVASGVFSFLNCIVDIPSIYLRKTTNKTCKVMMTFSFVFYPCGVVCVYSFLWIRQRVFYSSSTLALQRSKYLRWLSCAILPIFLVFIVSGLISTIAIYDYETSASGCLEVSGNDSPKIVLFVGILAIQITLLGLFVYPLLEHSQETENELPENKLLIALVRRACMTTGICFIADCAAFIATIAMPNDTPTIVFNLIRDGNLLVNVICIVCSFVDWKDRLAPVCRLYKDDGLTRARQGEVRLVQSVKSTSRESRKSNKSTRVKSSQEERRSTPEQSVVK